MKPTQLFNRLFRESSTDVGRQLFRYALVGGVAFAADYGTLWALTEYAGLYHLISAAVAFVVGLVVNYLLSIWWVFTVSRFDKAWFEFAVFAIIGIIGLGLNEAIIYVGTDVMDLHYMLSKVISTGLVFFWNFFARRTLLFQTNKHKQ